MGYFDSMDMLIPSLAALIAAFVAPAAAAARSAEIAGPPRSPVMRYDNGSAVTVTVSARIIHDSAQAGAGHAPPRMVPRRTTVSAADGSPAAALVYDFE